MPPPISVILEAYNPAWPVMASRLAGGLQVLGPVLLAVHHIGSTAVPGLAAKPIIDLMPEVTSLDELDRQRGCVESLGYQWHGEYGMTGRRYCTLSSESELRVAQVHFFEKGSSHVARHLAFRDYLRAHPEAVVAYENEKRRARSLHPGDSHAYSDEKASWVRAMEATSLAWTAV